MMKKSDKTGLLYAAGSIALFAAACLVIPAISRKLTNRLYKASIKKSGLANDDGRGPRLVKKETEE